MERTDDLGPMGARLAGALMQHVIEAIDDFPTVAPRERAAIAQTIAERLGEYADENDPLADDA